MAFRIYARPLMRLVCMRHQEGGMSSTIENFLPPKTTSRKQPFDMGVGYSFKQLYKYGLLNAMAKFEQVGVDGLFAPAKLHDDPGHGRRGLEDGHPPHVLDALKLITTSWDNITKNAIIRCWLKADILGEGLTRRMEELVGGDDSWVGSGLPEDELQLLKSKVVKVAVAQNCSKEYKIAVEAMKQLFSHSTVLDLHFAFDKYVTVEENQSQKEIEKEILKEIETPMDMEVEVVEAISTENMIRMEEAANIAATAFGDDHVSVRTMRQEITKKRMEKKVKQTTLFQFVKKPTSASSVSPILSKPTFEGSPSFPCQFSNLSLQK